MKKLLLLCTVGFLFACNHVKKTQEALNTGNYTSVINRAIKNIAENKNKKSSQTYIVLLEEAYQKNMSRELQQIKFLEKDANPANYESIFNSYTNLQAIQERIKPLLPLHLKDEGRQAQFKFRAYDANIITAKENLSDYVYTQALDLIENPTSKMDYRTAYNELGFLNKLNPNYKNTVLKREEAYQKGIDYIIVNLKNKTEHILPKRLEQELLNLNPYGLNNQWSAYHTKKIEGKNYDFEIEVSFEDIRISPEEIRERQITKEKQIKDGYRFVEDANGNVVSDSLGNSIRVDKFKTIRCDFYQFTQFKSVQILGVVSIFDLLTKQKINEYPLASEFVFEHSFANYNGDKRALENNLIALLELAKVPFPSNEQMIYDAGEDLKNNFKEIITRQNFN